MVEINSTMEVIPASQLILQVVIRDYKTKGYNEGNDIREEDIASAANCKWVTQEDQKIITRKSTMLTPTYGTCADCFCSGPTGKDCTECNNGSKYKVTIFDDTVLDSQTLAEFMGKGHEVAKADRAQNWWTTPTQRIGYDYMRIGIKRIYQDMEDRDARKVLVSDKCQEFLKFYSNRD